MISTWSQHDLNKSKKADGKIEICFSFIYIFLNILVLFLNLNKRRKSLIFISLLNWPQVKTKKKNEGETINLRQTQPILSIFLELY